MTAHASVRTGCAALVMGSVMLCLTFLLLAPPPAAAQQGAQRSSYITPFPKGDVYSLAVVGDSLAEGLIYGLREEIKQAGRVNVDPSVSTLSRLSFNTIDNKISDLKRDLAARGTHIAVVILGTQDSRRIATANGQRAYVGTPEWRAEYGRRVDLLMKELRGAGIAVYWIGLPNMRSQDADSTAQIINEVIRERAYLNSVKFIDIHSSFADEQGNYSAFGPDLSGDVKRLRWRDGIHFTGLGYTKVAHFVTREIRRDLAQAKTERTVPLAGTEAEQATIQGAAVEKDDDGEAISGWQASVDEAKQKVAARQEPKSFFLNAAGGEQKEEHGRINLKALGPNGREQIVSLEILRPAIPASVVALVTRKQSDTSAAQIGDTLVDETLTGLSIMSTITPASDAVVTGRRRKLSLAQTPFFRVLVKGDRLQPRPGRADDFSWPPPPLPELPPELDPTAVIAPAEESGGIPLPFPSPFRPRA